MSPDLDAILDAARTDDVQVRQQAALHLGTHAPTAASESIVACLLEEPDDFVRETFTWAVVSLGRAAVPYLVDALADPDTEPVRVLHTLSKIEDPTSAAAIAPFAEDEREAVAAKAWWALARLGRREDLPLLINHVGVAGVEQRAALARALVHVGPAALPQVTGLFDASNPQVRRHAIEIALRMMDPAARGTRSRYRKDPQEVQQLADAASAVIDTDAPEADEVLTELSLDFDHPQLARTAEDLIAARS